MPHIRFHDLRHTAATNMHQLTGVSLGLSMNFEAVTARYVDVRLERKKEVLDAYHAAVHPQPKQSGKEEPAPRQPKQKSNGIER